MIAPALISSVDNETGPRYGYSKTSLTSTTHLTNFIASLLELPEIEALEKFSENLVQVIHQKQKKAQVV